MQLVDVQHSLVGNVERRGISGGQRKRVNIGDLGGNERRNNRGIPGGNWSVYLKTFLRLRMIFGTSSNKSSFRIVVVKTFEKKNRLVFSRSLFKYEKASWAWNVKLWSFRFGSLTAKGVWFFHPPGRVVTGIMDEGISQASSKCHTFPYSWEQVAVHCHFHHSHDGCKETVFFAFFVEHEKPTRKWKKPKKTCEFSLSHPRFLAVHEFVDNLQLELLHFLLVYHKFPSLFSSYFHDFSYNLYVSCWFP